MEPPKAPRLQAAPTSDDVAAHPDEGAQWVEHVGSLAAALTQATRPADEERAVSRLWLLLNAKLRQLLLGLCRTHGWMQPEDIEEIASAKALELIRSIDTGTWKPQDVSVGEVVNYVVAVARNGMVDATRKSSRQPQGQEPDDAWHGIDDPGPRPDGSVAARELTDALADCLEELSPRPRQAWICRTFYSLSSRDIARQPELRTTSGNVDVLVMRARAAIRDCLQGKGQTFETAPAGCYAEIWKRFVADRVIPRPLSEEQ